MPTKPTKSIETFFNKSSKRDYFVKIKIPEFTCLCPMTGQPDFATIYIVYVPDELCIELKSLKLYMWSFRNQGAFHEEVSNQILEHLTSKTKPKYMQVTAQFLVRGGIYTTIVVDYFKDGFTLKKPMLFDHNDFG